MSSSQTSSSQTTTSEIFKISKPQPFDSLGLFTYLRTYARRRDENDPQSSVETWQECLSRVVNACNTQLNVNFTSEEQQEFFDLLYNLKCSVAGRFLWQLGTRTVDKLGLMSLQNCAFTVIDEPVKPFTWIMNFLMLGAGCGYRISQEDVSKFPVTKYAKIERTDVKDADYIVPDSRQGWIKLLGKVLKAHFYSGEGFTYSCHLLRSKGAPIKGFGGLSSGPEVLCDGISKINELLNKRVGNQITSVDALDIANIIGMIVVSGNVRRSAQIAIGDATDKEYMKAKRWDLGLIPNWRCYSNNSVICNDIKDVIDNEDFWAGYNGSGEPYGLINLKLARSCGRLGDTQYADPHVDGFNPCITAETWVTTSEGPRQVKDLIGGGKIQLFIDGKLYETTDSGFYLTRTSAKVLKLKTTEGYTLRATGNHRIMTDDGWKPLENLCKGDKILLHFHKNISWEGEGNFSEGYDLALMITETGSSKYKNYQKIESSSSDFAWGFIRGVYASIGWENEDKSLTLCYSNDSVLLEVLQRMMARFGIFCPIEYDKLNIGSDQNKTFMQIFNGYNINYDNMRTPMATVLSVVSDGICPTFDCTVPKIGKFDANGIVVSNCAEQSLAKWETCCLGEIYLPKIESYDELKKCATYIYRACKHSLSLPCADSKETTDVVHNHFRMGIGITGYLQATEEQRNWLDACYAYLREYDIEYSRTHNFPPSIKLTTCKPSGCSRGDSLIHTDKGLMRLDEIGDIHGHIWQDISDLRVKTDSNTYERVTKFYINGTVPTRKIKTENGFELESSLNHQYRVLNSRNEYVWKKVEDLVEGDKMLATIGNNNEKRKDYEIKTVPTNSNDPMIQTKILNDYDLSFILPYIQFRCIIGDDHIKFTKEGTDRLVEWICRIGLWNKMSDDGDNIWVHSTTLVRWIRLNGFDSQMSVPRAVRHQSSIQSYLFSLSRIANIKNNIFGIVNAVANEKFAQEVASLYRLTGCNVKIVHNNLSFFPYEIHHIMYKAESWWNEFVIDPIKSIEESSCPTYDIEVENAHHYLLSGFVSHNTLSILGHCTSGVHPGFAQYYIRRIRVSSESKLIKLARDHGYHVEYVQNFDGSLDYNTQVISFPYALPEGTILAENCTAVQQLEYVKRLQTEWSDNAVSVTVYYRKEELPEIKAWLKENYNNSVKTVSFLLHSDHGFKQAPLEKISKEEYEEMIRQTRPIVEVEDICHSTADDKFVGEGECVGGACPLK